MKHSVFIFTYNRSKLLKRQLRIFKLLGINSKIYLLDGSSNVDEIKRNKKIASDFEINYLYEKSVHNRFCLIDNLIETPYLSYCADDDIIDPRFYNRSVEFLEKNKGYAAVTGRILCLQYNSNFKFLGYRFVNHLPNDYDINSKDFISNIVSLETAYRLGCPLTLYGVRKLETHKILSKHIKKIKYYTSGEQLEKLSILLCGGVKTLDIFMGLRDYYNQPIIDEFRDSSDKDKADDDILLKSIVLSELILKGVSKDYSTFASNYSVNNRDFVSTTRKNYLSLKENKTRAIFEVLSHYVFNNVSQHKESGIDSIFLKAFRKTFLMH
jgi:glycosyltransferase domain-containing protein